nr:MAG TPA: hypothetical protein [Caudoviricetes sp.]
MPHRFIKLIRTSKETDIHIIGLKVDVDPPSRLLYHWRLFWA